MSLEDFIPKFYKLRPIDKKDPTSSFMYFFHSQRIKIDNEQYNNWLWMKRNYRWEIVSQFPKLHMNEVKIGRNLPLKEYKTYEKIEK